MNTRLGKRFWWAYLLSVLAVTLIFVVWLIRSSPNWFLRSPQARPPQGEPSESATPSRWPKATIEHGMKRLEPVIVDGVKTYDLVIGKVQWDVGGGVWKEAYSVNGMVPAPELRLMEGELVRLRVRNDMDEPTSVHWHGLVLPPEQDGVAHLSQDPIEPGQTFTYEFTPGPAGTHWYHSHFNGAKQVSNGLYGPLIVTPKDLNHPTHPSQYDVEHTIMIGDVGLGLTLNGKGFPYTLPMKVETGQRVLIRMINTGVGPHPMHLHGHNFYIVAKDGSPIAQPMRFDTVNISPGESYDARFIADNPGSWLYHCHILPHAENENGMFGLTALLEYKGYEPVPGKDHAPSKNRLPGTPGKHEH